MFLRGMSTSNPTRTRSKSQQVLVQKLIKLLRKFTWKYKGPRVGNFEKEQKLEDLHLISRLIIKLQESEQCGTGLKVDKEKNKTEKKPETDTCTYNLY